MKTIHYGHVDGVLVDRLDEEATGNGSAGNSGTDAHDTSRNEAVVVVLVDVSNLPDCNHKKTFV